MTSEEQSMPPQQSKKRMSRSNMDMTIGTITRARADAKSEAKVEAKSAEARSAAKSRSEQEFEDQQAANQEADAMLTKKLTICRDCMPSARDRDAAAAGSVMR